MSRRLDGSGGAGCAGAGARLSELRRFAAHELDDSETTAWVEPADCFDQLVASWSAETPPGTHVVVSAQARTERAETAWFVLGRWSADDTFFRRTSVPGQRDEHAAVAVDTLVARALPFVAYRLRVEGARDAVSLPVLRGTGGTTPRLRTLAACASRRVRPDGPSEPGGTAVDLAVPALSQMPHAGHFPAYGGGGASWCSPASIAMMLDFWGAGPSEHERAWVGEGHADSQVDHAARGTYDAAYGGCGNWSFGAAYAARYGLDAFVTRLPSLREAEALLVAGIPLVASIAAGPGELTGFPLPQGTDGHLVVLRGVMPKGDPVVNDPAAATAAEVPRTYDRGEFERAWLEGSGGATYVIHPPAVTLPASAGAW